MKNTSSVIPQNVSTPLNSDHQRMHYLDAIRAFALILGIFYHGALSFMPLNGIWAVTDVSTSNLVSAFIVVSHSFRLELFFMIAGFFSFLSLQRAGVKCFSLSRFLRIALPFAVGWVLMRPLIVTVWIAGNQSLSGNIELMYAIKTGYMSLIQEPEKLLIETHLWFLYYLLLITFIFLVCRACIHTNASLKSMASRLTQWVEQTLLSNPIGMLGVISATAIVLWFMKSWGVDTPDRSLIPELPPLVLYSMFFGVGWILASSKGLGLKTLPTKGWILWSTTLLSSTVVIMLSHYSMDPGHPQFQWIRLVVIIAYAFMMWSWVLTILGLFERFLNTSQRWIRYMADCSYWMYIIHLPIIVALQIWVAEWSISWVIKWPFITALTIAISVVTYDLVVRSTWVGRILNGNKRDRVIFSGFFGASKTEENALS